MSLKLKELNLVTFHGGNIEPPEVTTVPPFVGQDGRDMYPHGFERLFEGEVIHYYPACRWSSWSTVEESLQD